MRTKADTGESGTALFSEVKSNRGRPMAMAIVAGYCPFRPSVT
jgi:hypothetical protein